MRKSARIASTLAMCVTVSLAWLLNAGCALPPASADPEASVRSPYLPMLNAETVSIAPVYVNGAEPPRGAVERALVGFEEYVGGEVNLLERKFVQSTGAGESLNDAEFEQLVEEHADRGSTVITVFVTPALDFFGKRGFYRGELGGEAADLHIICLNAAVIDTSADRIPFVPRAKFWRLVLLHELCHILAVPSDPSHAWGGQHCTHPECILYPAVDRRSVVTAILRLGPPLKLCAACEGEIREAAARGDRQ